LKPLRAVFPIITADRRLQYSRQFLGTGFFIDSEGTFLTAKHVLDGPELGKDEQLAGVIIPHGLKAYRILDVRYCEMFDIAIGRLEGAEDIDGLQLATGDPPMNRDVICVEFSGTSSEKLVDGHTAMVFHPYFRKGNIIAEYVSRYPEPVPTECFELSFPALQGASGAPIIVEMSGLVAGMVIANIERHLLPAQVERIDSPSGQTEEIRYFLPVGKALKWKHLREFVDSAHSV